jgi:hypothetical protein
MFLQHPHIGHGHAAVHGFAHVVDGEQPVGWAEKPNVIQKPNPTRCLVLGFLRLPNLRIRLLKMAINLSLAGVFVA